MHCGQCGEERLLHFGQVVHVGARGPSGIERLVNRPKVAAGTNTDLACEWALWMTNKKRRTPSGIERLVNRPKVAAGTNTDSSLWMGAVNDELEKENPQREGPKSRLVQTRIPACKKRNRSHAHNKNSTTHYTTRTTLRTTTPIPACECARMTNPKRRNQNETNTDSSVWMALWMTNQNRRNQNERCVYKEKFNPRAWAACRIYVYVCVCVYIHMYVCRHIY